MLVRGSKKQNWLNAGSAFFEVEMESIIALLTFIITIIVNAILVSFFLGTFNATLESLKKEEYKEESKEGLKRLEGKQDRHNNLIERVAIVEQSSKSAHHRQDEISERLTDIERRLHEEDYHTLDGWRKQT